MNVRRNKEEEKLDSKRMELENDYNVYYISAFLGFLLFWFVEAITVPCAWNLIRETQKCFVLKIKI